MPLATIKYKPDGMRAAKAMMDELPELLYLNREELGLGEEMSLAATQVELLPFGVSRFAPDTWLMIKFTEAYPGKEEGLAVRDLVNSWVIDLRRRTTSSTFSFALDIFWGPGHGILHLSSLGGWTQPIFW